MGEILVLIIFKNGYLSEVKLFSSFTKLSKYINENILKSEEEILNVNNIEDVDKILEGTIYKGTKIEAKTINN